MEIIENILSYLARDKSVYDERVREVYSCALWTAVMTRNWGMSSSFKEDHPNHGRVKDAGSLRGKAALELAEYAKSDNLLEASIGMAAINSLIEINASEYVSENAFDILAEKGGGKNIAVVGHFPWIPALKEMARKFWVLEQRPRGDDLPAEFAGDILPYADVVGITGTSLINHTFSDLIKLCKDSFVVMVGPTSPLSPVLFDYGVDVISGTRVVEPDEMVACITEGAMLKQVKGIKLVSIKKKE